VGEFSLGKISIGIVLMAIIENNKRPMNNTNTVIGLFKAARTIIILFDGLNK
jgi:hypothetical protein